ncbi:MAG: hypothetical protein GY820_27645 [Gammaproteobacteria bacterium]|nr:hypothetical protein [Gammaproteobacteria bacterium]
MLQHLQQYKSGILKKKIENIQKDKKLIIAEFSKLKQNSSNRQEVFTQLDNLEKQLIEKYDKESQQVYDMRSLWNALIQVKRWEKVKFSMDNYAYEISKKTKDKGHSLT